MGIKDDSAQWISMSDMMSGLMLVFLLIAVAFMYQVQLKQKEQNKILYEYNDSKEQISEEINDTFKDNFEKWGMKTNKDLSIKFDVDFDADLAILKPELKNILDNFLPEYIKILNNPKYKERIKEVRIEGHTGKCKDFEYKICLELSQRRANNVLIYLQNNQSFKKLKEEDKEKLNFWLTSNGMGDGKGLDNNGNFVYESKLEFDNKKSRRVEFKIITNSDKIIKNITNK